MLSFLEFLTELKIAKLYTVAPSDLPRGEDLKSMSTQFGKKEGRVKFKEKWSQDSDMPKLPPKYADNVHLTRDAMFAMATKDYHQNFSHKKMSIYDVRPSHKMQFTDKGGNIAMVKDSIPAKYIRKKWNGKKWENFNAPNTKDKE